MISRVSTRRGFTLFEVVLVLAILIVLGALVVPSVNGMAASYQVTAASDMIRGGWASARSRAMDEGRPYRFAVTWGKGDYRIAPDSPEYWAGGGGTTDPNSSADGTGEPALIVEDTLPKPVVFENADASAPQGTDAGAWSTLAVFLPDGTARADAWVVLQAKGTRPLRLYLRGLTGTVTVKYAEGEGRRP
jgi:prepilin-type N-terminal cleavage/methylation domain-containing protein